jgi:hypothetical protein
MNQAVSPGVNTGTPIDRNGPGVNTSGSPNSRQGPNSGQSLRDPFASLRDAKVKTKAKPRVKAAPPPKHPPGTPFVLNDYAKHIGGTLVGSGSCVALPQTLVPAVGNTSLWRRGEAVVGNKTILPGTLVATFETNGKYLSNEHDNHAAIYIAQVTAGENGETQTGIKVLDQWKGKKPHPPQTRVMSTTIFKTYEKPIKTKYGVNTLYENPSDNGNALFIIVH